MNKGDPSQGQSIRQSDEAIRKRRLAEIQGPSISFKRARPQQKQNQQDATATSSRHRRQSNQSHSHSHSHSREHGHGHGHGHGHSSPPRTSESASATKTTKSCGITSPYGRCPNVSERYKKIGRIGEGTYGIVYKAIDKNAHTQKQKHKHKHKHKHGGGNGGTKSSSQEYVALKRCLPHHEASDGFPITTLREIQLLREIAMDHDNKHETQNESTGNPDNCGGRSGDGGGGGHENIIKLREVAVGTNSSAVFLVFEYVRFDLAKLVDEHFEKYGRSPFSLEETKCLAGQLFSALEYLHDSKCIIHRDLKLSNMLYCNERGLLKLADFGLARRLSPPSSTTMSTTMSIGDSDYCTSTGAGDGNCRPKTIYDYGLPPSPPMEHLTPKVVSLWYRSPELLLQAESYTVAVDQWAAGCAIAELILGQPIFPGKGEMDQLSKIVSVLGAPSIEDWPGLVNMPLFRDQDRDGHGSSVSSTSSCAFPFRVDDRGVGHEQVDFSSAAGSDGGKNRNRGRLLDIFSDLSASGVELFTELLRYDPERRWNAKRARRSEWFSEWPRPTEPALMPKFENKL